MATGRRRRTCRHGPGLAGLLLAVAAVLRASEAVAAVSSLGPPHLDRGSDAQCVHLAPRILTTQQKQLLCSSGRSDIGETGGGDAYDEDLDEGEGDLTLPAKCAALALETRTTQPFATKRENKSVLPHVLDLCAGARDLEPVSCWLQFPTHQRHHQVTTDAYSTSPFIDVCRSAQDAAPAKCFQVWLRSSAFLLARYALDAQPTAIRVCRSLRTHMMSEFAVCVKKGVRLVGAAAAFPLCQFVVPGGEVDGQATASNRRAVVDCARTLARQRLPALAIADACARATSSLGLSAALDARQETTIRPEACMLEVQRSLTQWMDATLFGTLCDRAIQGATAPVECASMLKQDAHRRLDSLSSTSSTSQTQRRRQLSEFVARMCRGAVNASAVGACVQLLPSKTLSVAQAERLCSAAVITRSGGPNDASDGNLFPAQCVARANPMLAMMARQRQHQRAHLAKDDNESDSAALMIRLCEKATSLAPSECLASTQFDRRLSTELVVALCARASSDAPQRNLRRLQQQISSNRLTVEDAVALCSDSDTTERPNRAADCAERALRELGAHVPGTSELVTDLCAQATSAAPAECFRQAPSIYSPTEKVALCRQANSTDPARCASQHLKRLSTSPQDHQHQIDLCRGATSQSPAQCAKEAPYGMSAREIVLLCRRATSAMPAICARAISPSLRLPPEAAARVCSQAASTLPARCLSQEASVLLRRSEPITGGVIHRCRAARAELVSLEITHVAYTCEQLRVNCPLSLTLRAFDQFSDEMPALSAGYLHASAEYEASLYDENVLSDGIGNASIPTRWPLHSSTTSRHPPLSGRTVVPIVNSTAVFSDLQFSSPGRFTLTFRVLPNGPEKIAWIRIHPDVEADSLVHRCHALFLDQFQCATNKDASSEQQYLKLPRQLFFQAADCHQHWAATTGGLAPLPASRQLLFSMPRAVYDFLMCACGIRTRAPVTEPLLTYA